MGSHEYIPVGGEQQPLREQAGTMLIAGHPVYHPPDTVQPFGKVTGPGMQRDAPQLFQREVDTADDRPFPVRCQVRAVLPEVVAENPQRVSGAEEQPDTFSEGRFPEVGRAPADDVEAVGVHELPQRVTVREDVPQCPHQCPSADSAAARCGVCEREVRKTEILFRKRCFFTDETSGGEEKACADWGKLAIHSKSDRKA